MTTETLTLTDDERDAIRRAIYPDGYSHPFHREDAVAATVEAIIAARLARVEALADEWDPPGNTYLHPDGAHVTIKTSKTWYGTRIRAALAPTY